MNEDDTVELLWKSGQIVQSNQTQRLTSDPPILRGSGSGGNGREEEENALFPPPPHQNIFTHEDEMASWFHHPLGQDYYGSNLLYSDVIASTPSPPLPQIPVSLTPPPSPPYDFLTSQIIPARSDIFTGGRVEAGRLIPLVQVGPSSTATVIGGVSPSPTFAVPGLGGKEKAVAIETGASSSRMCKVETEPIQVQPATETEIADDRKRKEREEEIQETKEARGSTLSRKRSRAADMHNLAERKRREKINEKMKVLQEIVPRCNKSDKASMLHDVIEYIKWLQMQVQMKSTMYTPNMQQFMAMWMMGMNQPPFIASPGTHFLGQSYPAARYPFPSIQDFDPSRVHLPSQQPDPMSNQPQFPGYLDPYIQFVGPHLIQQSPPLQNQTSSSHLSFGQASSSKEPEDQKSQPTSVAG